MSDNADLADIRVIAWCLTSFAGFLRYSELATLKEADVRFFNDHLESFIESSKTDQFGDGSTVAANTGVPNRLFKRHGRWRSENAEDGYVKVFSR